MSEDQAFAEVHHVLVSCIGDLGLDHPEFGQVTAGLGFLRAKRRAEGVGFAKRRSGRFVIKLAGLGQIRLVVAKIIDLEQCRRAFARRRRKDRRVGKRKSVIVKIIAVLMLERTDPESRRGALATLRRRL